jgi:Carboxypeptidase regulatory-like domain
MVLPFDRAIRLMTPIQREIDDLKIQTTVRRAVAGGHQGAMTFSGPRRLRMEKGTFSTAGQNCLGHLKLKNGGSVLMRKILVVGLFLSACCFTSTSVRGQAGINTGNIAGTVTDSSGAVVGGVTVEASSPALIERARTTVTDSSGLYKIVNLPPGTYGITFTKDGFNTFRREGILLTVAFTATVNAALEVGSVSQTVTVTGESPVIDTQDTVVQQTLSNNVVMSLPLGQSAAIYQSLIPGAVASATKQDVGGTQGESSQGFRIHGSSSGDYHQLRDGMFYGTLVAAGNFMSSSNPTSVQEIQIVTSGYSAEDWTGGGHVNIIPKNGGNDFHGAFSANWSNNALQGNNVSPALQARDVGKPGQIKSLYEIAGGVGGSIMKDKLWYFVDARRWVSDQTQVGNYFNANEALTFPNNLYYAADTSRPAYVHNYYNDEGVRLTWQASNRNKITLNFIEEQNCNCFFNITNGTTAPEATGNDKYTPNWRAQATWTFPVNNKLLLWAGFTAVIGSVDRSTTGSLPTSIPVTDLSSNDYIYGAAGTGVGFTTSYGTNTFRDVNENFMATYVTGAHAFKFGYTEMTGRETRLAQFVNNGISYQFRCAAVAAVPGTPLLVNSSNGLPTTIYTAGVKDANGNLIVFNPPNVDSSTVNSLACPSGQALLPNKIAEFLYPYNYHVGLEQHTLFAQDQWRIKRLTANLGLRFEMFTAGSPAQSFDANTQFGIPAQSYPAQRTVDWKDLDPRFGVAYDLFGNGRTALKMSIARSTLFDALGGMASKTNPAVTISTATTRTWNDFSGTFLPDTDSPNGLTTAAASGSAGSGQAVTPGGTLVAVAPCAASGTGCAVGKASSSQFYAQTQNEVAYDSNVTGGFDNREYDWQLSASVQHEITPGISLEFGYYRTWFGNLAVVSNVLTGSSTINTTGGTAVAPGSQLPASAYDPYCVNAPTDPRLPDSGGKLCNLYDLQPQFFGHIGSLVEKASKFGGQSDVYTGIDATVTARFHGLLVAGGFTAGHEVTNYCVQVNSPMDLHYYSTSTALEFNNQNFSSSNTEIPCLISPPWYQNLQFKMQAVYTLPWQHIKLSVSEQNLPSIATTASYSYTSASNTTCYPSTAPACAAGTFTSVPVLEWGVAGRTTLSGTTGNVQLITPETLHEEGRNNQFDFRVAKEFHIKERWTIEPTVDFFNLFNAGSVLAMATTYNNITPGTTGAWKNVNTLLNARIIKFGVHVDF